MAKEKLREGFVFFYSDVLFDPEIVKELIKNKSDICLSIKKNGVREEAEKVVEKEGKIMNISKTRTSEENGEFIGLAKFSKEGAKTLIDELDLTAKINLNSSLIEVIDSLIKKGENISSLEIKNAKFIDIDFPEDLKKAEELFA